MCVSHSMLVISKRTEAVKFITCHSFSPVVSYVTYSMIHHMSKINDKLTFHNTESATDAMSCQDSLWTKHKYDLISKKYQKRISI